MNNSKLMDSQLMPLLNLQPCDGGSMWEKRGGGFDSIMRIFSRNTQETNGKTLRNRYVKLHVWTGIVVYVSRRRNPLCRNSMRRLIRFFLHFFLMGQSQ
jgi:hypothetical protein